MNDYEDLLQTLKGIVESFQSLNQRAVREYTPGDEGILRSRSRDISPWVRPVSDRF
jgi:hypothetical protein